MAKAPAKGAGKAPRARGAKTAKKTASANRKTAQQTGSVPPEIAALNAKRDADAAAREKLMNDLKSTTAGAAMAAQQAGAQANANAAAGLGADKVALLGNAVWLLTQTPTHKHLFITDLEWLVIPPVALDQFRLWRQGNMPVAFATWAYLSEDAEERLKQGVRRLSPMDWKSGDTLWLMDMIAPFGGADEAMKELREKIFPGQKIKTLQPAPSGDGMAVVEW